MEVVLYFCIAKVVIKIRTSFYDWFCPLEVISFDKLSDQLDVFEFYIYFAFMLSKLIFEFMLYWIVDSDGEVEEFLPNITQNVIEELEKAGELFQECYEPLSMNVGDLSLPNGIYNSYLFIYFWNAWYLNLWFSRCKHGTFTRCSRRSRK